MAADKATPEAITFMIRYTSGVICVPLTGEDCDRLELAPMVLKNTESHQTAFTVSTDYKIGTTTGIIFCPALPACLWSGWLMPPPPVDLKASVHRTVARPSWLWSIRPTESATFPSPATYSRCEPNPVES